MRLSYTYCLKYYYYCGKDEETLNLFQHQINTIKQPGMISPSFVNLGPIEKGVDYYFNHQETYVKNMLKILELSEYQNKENEV